MLIRLTKFHQLHHKVTYDDPLLVSLGINNPQVTQCRMYLSEENVYPEDMFEPGQYVSVPTEVLCNLYVTDWNYNDSLPARFHQGVPGYPVKDSNFISVNNSTLQYACMELYGPIMVEIVTKNNTLMNGTNIGLPYIVDNSWSSITDTEVWVCDPPVGSVQQQTFNIIVTVIEENATVTVPAGTFTDCDLIESIQDQGDGPELFKREWYSRSLAGLVKIVNPFICDGVETWELQAYIQI